MTSYLDDYCRCVSGDIEYATQIFNHKYNYRNDYDLMNAVVYKLALKNIYLPASWITQARLYYGWNYINYKHYTPAMIKLYNEIGWDLSDHNLLQILKYNSFEKIRPRYSLLPMSIPYILKHISRAYGIRKFEHPTLALHDIAFITYISSKYLYLLDQYQYDDSCLQYYGISCLYKHSDLYLCRKEHIRRYFLNKISIDAQTYKLYIKCRGACAIYIEIMNEYQSSYGSNNLGYSLFYYFHASKFIFE